MDPTAPRVARPDRSERLLGLVVVLLGSDVPVARSRIRTGVVGYADARTDAAFERMFERDKDELRSMGIPIETVRDGSDEVLGYRIDRSQYALGPVAFTVAERTAIAVAAQAWGQAALAGVAGSALRKLDADTDTGAGRSTDTSADTRADAGPWPPVGVHGLVRLTAADAALPALMTAVRERATVTFAYRGRADSGPRTRTLSPWGIRSAAGVWFAIGHDHDRRGLRTFRLSRVIGPVEAADVDPVGPPAGFDVAAVPLEPTGGDRVAARVRVAAGRGAGVRRLAAGGDQDPWEGTELTVEAASIERLVAAVCAEGSDVVVLDPPEVVDAVRTALLAVRATARASGPGGGRR